MNNSHQETSPDTQETEFGGPAGSKQRRTIHFSSGETLEEEDSEEEEEQSSDRPPFTEPAQRVSFSCKNVAILVGRISLLTCDFLGERLAGALGLKAAKYQYAIDQYDRDHKSQTTSSQTTDELRDGEAETLHLSQGVDGAQYGATADTRSPQSCDEKQTDGNKGCHNRGYQEDEDCLE
ncbi:protein FAM177A1 [Sparus aurata]|uniref:Protein FAM177A1-like n=1 Tax=Sparus aurata TaxID=8175 RepID=A0A671XG45_SPAAU|nr:protein FAM177B [Sparus aurata]